MIRIKKLNKTRFLTQGESGTVTVDFAPMIAQNNLQGNYVLGHWNRMICKPAFYCSSTETYHVGDEQNIMVDCAIAWVGIPKKDNPGVLPTSCNYHPNARIEKDGAVILIKSLESHESKQEFHPTGTDIQSDSDAAGNQQQTFNGSYSEFDPAL